MDWTNSDAHAHVFEATRGVPRISYSIAPIYYTDKIQFMISGVVWPINL